MYKMTKTGYIFIDVETDGIGTFRPPRQHLTQLAFIKTDKKGNILQTYSKLIKGVTKLAQIPSVIFTLDQLNEHGIPLVKALNDLKKAMEDKPIFIAHNLSFDHSILVRDSKKVEIDLNIRHTFCTMLGSVDFCKIEKVGFGVYYPGYKWPRLSELASALGIKYDSTRLHDAEEDTRVLKECFFEGKKREIW